jgi:sigma-E factor negative regulatory protein RseA
VLNREETMNKTNHDELISSMLDGELTDAQLDAVLTRLKSDEGKQIQATWDQYHQLGDVLRSEDLAVPLSADFSQKFSALLDAEPVILAPKSYTPAAKVAKETKSKAPYFAISSMAAAVMVAFIMAPQIIPLLRPQAAPDAQMAKVDQTDGFAAPGVKLASNASASGHANSNDKKELEFAPKLENQVEMLRDPILDSYLLAHQKVSPSFDNGARYIKRANVVSSSESEK